ncbi:MAG: hypothetical protein JXA96_10445 [Sedimentisphaerales bacterium]|nr:hypothetical protein [Sedimentisphaerales bacterium]
MLNSSRTNSDNACHAFIQIIEQIKGIKYEISQRPDEKNRQTQDVDFIIEPTDKKEQSPKIAVEHTIIEAYEEQIAYVNQSYDIVKEINKRCEGKLPKDRYFKISIPQDFIVKASKRIRNCLIKEMEGWIPNIAKNLNIREQCSLFYNKQKIWLECGGSSSKLNGKVVRIPMSPDKDIWKRKERFRRSIEQKLSKLVKYKENDFTTALLLEDVSGIHCKSSDHWSDLIPTQYQSEFQTKIDYVVIFDSYRNEMILGLIWKEGSKIYSEIPENRRFDCFNFKL